MEPQPGQTWHVRANPSQTVVVERVTRGVVFTDSGRMLRKTWHERMRPADTLYREPARAGMWPGRDDET